MLSYNAGWVELWGQFLDFTESIVQLIDNSKDLKWNINIFIKENGAEVQ